jgi:hypothetical protein
MAKRGRKKKHSKEKNPIGVAFGMLGASKGGKARAKKLSPERRREIAKQAAAARMTTISAARRKEIARKAILARWSKAK